jgi:hypothetical protein
VLTSLARFWTASYKAALEVLKHRFHLELTWREKCPSELERCRHIDRQPSHCADCEVYSRFSDNRCTFEVPCEVLSLDIAPEEGCIRHKKVVRPPKMLDIRSNCKRLGK